MTIADSPVFFITSIDILWINYQRNKGYQILFLGTRVLIIILIHSVTLATIKFTVESADKQFDASLA